MSEELKAGSLLQMATTIVAAHVSKSSVPAAEIPRLLGDIYQALATLLGSQFVDLRLLPAPSLVTKPDSPQFGPGIWTPPTAFRRTFKLLHNLTGLAEQSLAKPWAYTMLDGSVVPPSLRLQPGELFVLSPGVAPQRERRVVDSVGPDVEGHAAIYATFANGHEAGSILAVQPFPYWISNRRHWTVQLTPTAAATPEIRRQVNRLMRKVVRGVSTWRVIGSAGPFLLGSSPLNFVPLGS